MRRRVYDWMLVKPNLQIKRLNLSGVRGGALKIDGCINLKFIIGGIEMQHIVASMQ